MHTLFLIFYVLAAVICFTLAVKIERRIYGKSDGTQLFLSAVIALIPVVNMFFILFELLILGAFNIFHFHQTKSPEVV